MKIFFLSAEAYPFAKTGGLADAVSSLAKALSLSGHQVNILIPRYYSINKEALNLVKKDVFVSLGPIEVRVNFYLSQLPESSVNVYFMDFEKFFGRQGIYGPSNTSEYNDNPVRFSLFCRSLFRLCECINFKPDIIHVHDWASALAPVFLKYQERKNSFFSDTKSVITVHNAAYQGKFPVDSYKFLGLPEELRFPAGFEDSYSVNFLKAGLTSSDWITTVSPSYAKEIQNDQFGEGLAGLYRVRSSTLTGILNGIDDKVWSPEIDKNLPANYSIENISGKALCKEALQKKFGLQVNSSIPVISLISRLVPQKGISEVFAPMYGAIYKICTELPLQFIVIGSGEEWCQKEILSLDSRLGNFKAFVGYDDALSHLAEAGSDLFLMPSKYEPCGLNQMYSMRYGTLPIVRSTGGLKDSVENYNPSASGIGKGTGFVFDFLTPEAIFNTVKWAVESWYGNKSDISQMIKNAMTKDFSWKNSAEKYVEVYNKIRQCP